MGEETWRIFTIGAPGLDEIFQADFLTQSQLTKKYGIHFDAPLILIIQHPVLTEIEMAGHQMKETLEALRELNYQTY